MKSILPFKPEDIDKMLSEMEDREEIEEEMLVNEMIQASKPDGGEGDGEIDNRVK